MGTRARAAARWRVPRRCSPGRRGKCAQRRGLQPALMCERGGAQTASRDCFCPTHSPNTQLFFECYKVPRLILLEDDLEVAPAWLFYFLERRYRTGPAGARGV